VRRVLRGAVALAVLALPVALATCSVPTAGDLTVSLVTPNSDDGAIVVRVTASQSKEITSAAVACTGCRIFAEQPSATELRAVVTGNLAAGPLVRISVSDTGAPTAYAVQIVQVASRTYRLRPTSGYSLSIQ
jgi:uncharacterized protein (DUF2141 family)